MEDQNGLDQLGLHFEEHNAALSAILNNRVDDAEAVLSVLSPAQLKQLELNVKNMKRNRGSGPSSAGTSKSHKDHHASSLAGMSSITNQHLMHDYATTLPHPSLSAHDDHSLLLHNHHSLLDMSQHLQDPQLNSSLSSSALILSPTGSHLSPHHSHHHSTNLPASCPILEIRDGTEYLMFTYSTKGQQQEFAIKTEIECISVEEIPDDFKAENCVYPRAFCRREQYVGNRWEYETACNDLAWKLTWINSEILSGKRGLIQRAVDSYRNRLTEMRSRRVIRQEKLSNGTLRRRATESSDAEAIYQHQMALAASPNAPPFFLPQGHLPSAEKHHSYGGSGRKSAKKMTVPYPTKEGQVAKISFFINIDSVGPEDEDDIFKMENCIYPDTWGPEVGDARREYEMECNDIAWKLAHLNKQTLAGKKYLLQKAVDYYREMSDSENISSRSTHKSRPGRKPKQTPHPLQDTTNFSYSHQDHSHNPYLSGQMPLGMGMGGIDFESQKQEEFSAIVANTLQQALSHHDLSGHDLSSVVGDLELNGHTDASSLYESFHPHLYDSGNNGFYH